jgi:hypothetical protein
MRKFGKRTMSSNGTAHHTAREISGRCVSATPTRRPPFEPPTKAVRSGEAMPSATSQSAAAWKSSNTFCLFPRRPAWCHRSPCSYPPRSPAIAHTPPAAHHAARFGSHVGDSLMAKPP